MLDASSTELKQVVTCIKLVNMLYIWHYGHMSIRPVPAKVVNSARELGAHVSTWRKLQGLTMAQVAERAGVTRDTVSRVERGEVTVGLDTFLGVLRALGRLDSVVDSLDPYDTDFGRARADQILPKRVRS